MQDEVIPIPDAEVPDAEVPDAEVPDAEVPDAEVPDAEVPDAEVPDESQRVPGMGETEILPGGGITEGDAVPEMPPGSDMSDQAGGGLTADDMAQPTSTADTTGDRATGLTSLRGG